MHKVGATVWKSLKDRSLSAFSQIDRIAAVNQMLLSPSLFLFLFSLPYSSFSTSRTQQAASSFSR